jgi:hydrogenase maturation protease
VAEYRLSNETILVIGYGNELRGDDGLGPFVAEAIAAANYPNVQVRTVFQLVPELAAELAEARVVIFVDALADPSRIAVELASVEAEEITDWSTHIADPRALLALTQAVYGRTPEAWWLMVPGRNFDFGAELTSAARENGRQAVARLNTLIQAKTRYGLSVSCLTSPSVIRKVKNQG